MNDQPTPTQIRRFSEQLIECGVQLAGILDFMFRHESTNPEALPPPETLRNLLAETLAPRLSGKTADVKRATRVLELTTETIASEFFFVDPDGLNDSSEPEPLH